MNDKTYERVRRIVAKYLEIPTEQVQPESMLAELGVDSLATLELLFEIEDEFKITVPDERVVGLDTVRSVCERIEALQDALPS
jgi:acyl carrier protein